MPRYENGGLNVNKWYETDENGSGTSTFDLCAECGETHDGKMLAHVGISAYNVGEPDGILMGPVDTPLVDDYDLDGYTCEVCGIKLTSFNY